MRFSFFAHTIRRKFWPLILVLILVVGVGAWYRFWGPGEMSSQSLKSYNSVQAALNQLKQNPNDFEAAMQAGVGYYNLLNLKKAEEYYLRAAQIMPSSAVPWNNLGNTYRELLRYEDSEAAYRRAITMNPTSVTPYLNLVELYTRWPVEEIDPRPKIPQILLEALKATNRNVKILQALADYYEAQGNPAKAQEYRDEIKLREAEDEHPPSQS